MSFNDLLRHKKKSKGKRIWVKKTSNLSIVKSVKKTQIGTRVIGNPNKSYEVELLNFQERTPIFKGGKGTVELHLVRDTSNGDIHYRVLDTLYDNDGNIIESGFADNGEGGEKFSSVEDALENALLDHRQPILSGMGKTWTENIEGNSKRRKMFVLNNGSNLLYSVLDIDGEGVTNEHRFDDEDSAQDFFLS